MYLGEIILESFEGELTKLDDSQISEYIQRIGDRIAKHMPNVGLTYKFQVVDMPMANAFTTAGGNIFVTRKLISISENEDELAGVIAHELGHAVVRHSAIELTRLFKQVLGETRVGDKDDIRKKYNALIENAAKNRSSQSSSHIDSKQVEADEIGVYSMAAAGYDPEAFTKMFDRIAGTEGKTGNWFTNIFGSVGPNQKRLRKIIDLTKNLPAECREATLNTENSFFAWQAKVVNYRETARKEVTPGLVFKRELSPKLRSDITNIAFNRDGSRILVQDDFAVTVVQREPLKVLYQFPAPNAQNAVLSPDGKTVTLLTEGMRFEKWDVDEKQPIEAREFFNARGCETSEISPDGNFFACVNVNSDSADISLVDTRTGNIIFEGKKAFNINRYSLYFAHIASLFNRNTPLFNIKFSPDSKFAVFSRAKNNRVGLVARTSGVEVVTENDKARVIDVTLMKEIDEGNEIKKITAGGYAFVSNELVVGNPSNKVKEGGVFTFPEGVRKSKFDFAGRNVESTQNSDFVLINPIEKDLIGIFDVKNGVVASAISRKGVAIWNDIVAFEGTSGNMLVNRMEYDSTKKKIKLRQIGELEIPAGQLGKPEAVAVSDNFRWVAISSRSRGAMWNLGDGSRKFFVLGFEDASLDGNGIGIVAFEKDRDKPKTLAVLNAADGNLTVIKEPLGKLTELKGRFLIERKNSIAKPVPKRKNNNEDEGDDEEEDSFDPRSNTQLEITDLTTNQVVWERKFDESLPRNFFDPTSNRIALYWNIESKEARKALDANPTLKAKAAVLGEKKGDYLVEVIDILGKEPNRWLLIETGKGSFRISVVGTQGDWLMVYDSTGRVLVYSIEKGEIIRRYFARYAAINEKLDLIAVENVPGKVSVQRVSDRTKIQEFVVNGQTSYMRFSENGRYLLILTDLQNAYVFDLSAKP
ncbi:MAG: M48 family metalloprotease [Pyrinomonadaceae bacterium]